MQKAKTREDSGKGNDTHQSTGSNGTQVGVALAQTRSDMRDWILLDSQSSVDLFCNPELVTDIRHCQETLLLTTNYEENKDFFNKKQLKKAKQARMLLESVGFPSLHDLKRIISANQIANCPVTLDDMDLAESIYGPSLGFILKHSSRYWNRDSSSN